ncbi:hypothetical protein NP493_1843g00004 [Ridgeia piscesae]|uniref:Uncharacterized protein n=1 Tax=Ridgeia piscesae TaxID=27915 RepID=A0AAD9JRM6_RIDPI|nr:hypothetical protein NP493_1843g00004 [Ridgeia piscesae]
MMETVISAVVDEFRWLRKPRRKMVFTLLLCIALFFAGLPQCSRAGIYIMTLFDWYCAGFSLMVVSLLELIAIGWIYNYKRFSTDIEMMIGFKPNYYWIIMWLFVTPATILFILGYSIFKYSPATYAGKVYPGWALNLGWGMVAIALVFIPILAIFEYCKESNFYLTMKRILSPNKEWGPAVDKFRTGLYASPETFNGVSMNHEPGPDNGYGNDNMAFDQEKL